MAFPLLSALVPTISSVLDRVIPDKNKAAKAKLEMQAMIVRGDLKKLEVRMSAILAEAHSEYWLVALARPLFMYVMYLLFLLAITGGIMGIWWPAEVKLAAEGIGDMFAAIPTPLYTLFGIGYLGYVGGRSFDKNSQAKEREAREARGG